MALAAEVAQEAPFSPAQLGSFEEPEQPERVPKRGPMPRRFKQEDPIEKRQAFMEKTSLLTDEDWERTLIYVYQWAPIVDLTRGGQDKKYRKIYTRHMSEEAIKRDLGSGRYELKLNQLGPSGRGEKTIDRLIISIVDYDFPPNIPPGPWLDDPANADWQWAKPLLEARYKKPNGTGEGVPAYMVQFMTDVRAELNRRSDLNPSAKDQLMSSVVTILPALLQQQNSANDPSKMLEALTKVRDMFAPAVPAQDNTMLSFLLAELKSSREQQTLLMTKLFEIKSEQTKQPDPLSQVKTMAELITLVSGIVQPPLAKEPWQDVVETLGPEVLKTVNTVAGAFAMGGRSNPPRPQPHVVTVQPQPVSQTPVQPQPVQSQTVPPIPEPVPAPIPEPADTMDTGMRSMIYQVAVLATNALNLGMLGEQFADQVCYKFGQAVYDQFIAAVPKETLLDRFKSVPEAWQLLQPFEAQLPSFIESFYAFATEEPGEEPKTISEPEPVKPRKGAKKK